MNPSSRPVWRTALVGVALAVVAVLFIAPQSRWLARTQFAAAGFARPQSDERREADETAQRQRMASRFPADVNVQIAAALDGAGEHYSPTGPDINTFRMAALRGVVRRFPDSSTLYAALTRYATGGTDDRNRVHVARPEEDLLSSYTPPPDAKYTRPDPHVLAQYDADCAAGERLDPANAYFPFMRAVGLFAAYRDTDAVNAVLRAGQKPVWNDYAQDETEGRLRIYDASTGGQYALGRVSVAASLLLPHFASLRAAARVATVKAMQMEQAGNVEGGLALRRALMNVGDRMRVQSPTLIGNLVGIAIAQLATLRPGGAPALKSSPPAGLSDVQTRHWRMARLVTPFVAYVNGHGHAEMAQMARAQAAATEAQQALYVQAAPKAIYNKLVPHVALWVVDEIVLAVVFWLLVLGIAARLLARRTAYIAGRPLPRSVKGGIGVAILAALAVLGIIGTGALDVQFNALCAVFVTLVVGAGALFLLRRRVTKPALARFTGAVVGTLLVLAGVSGLISWQAHNIAVVQQLSSVWALQGEDRGSDAPGWGAYSATLSAGAITLALPFLLTLIFAIAGRVRRVPVNVAVVRGFRTVAVPAACVLVILWGGLCLHTLRQERALNAELDRSLVHEGRYYAALAGAPWPGRVVR